MKNTILILICAFIVSSCTTKSSTITQMVTFTVKPEYIKEFRQAQVNSLNRSLEEDGNLEMKLFANDDNPYVLYVFSKWKDTEAYELHKNLPHSKALGPLFEKALAAKPEILRLEDIKYGHIDSKELKSTGNEQALFIPITVKEGFRNSVINKLVEHVAKARKEDGNIFFDFYAVEGQENKFYIYENWENAPAIFESHMNKEYAKETITFLNQALVGNIEENITLASEYDENTLNEKYTLEKIWEAEDVIMPESILLIPNHDYIYVSVINTYQKPGYISRFTKDGKLDKKMWAEDINIPTGMAYNNGKVYVVDQSQVHIIDLETGKILKTIKSEAKTLNDISIGKDGIAYISDLTTGRIFKMEDDSITLWLHSDKFPIPNGVLVNGNDLIVGSLGSELSQNLTPEQFGSLFKINISNKSVSLVEPSEKMGALDGVVQFKKGFIASDPMNGKIFYVTNYKKEQISSFGGSNADIGIDVQNQILYVPYLFENKIGAYKIVKKE